MARPRSVKIRKPYLAYSLPKRKKRTSARILRDILYVARHGEKKTHILFSTNLNPAVLERYLELASGAGLIEKRGRLYVTTEKGLEYVENYDLFESLVKDLRRVERQIDALLRADHKKAGQRGSLSEKRAGVQPHLYHQHH